MKITKSRLQNIIKEAVAKVVNENRFYMPSDLEKLVLNSLVIRSTNRSFPGDPDVGEDGKSVSPDYVKSIDTFDAKYHDEDMGPDEYWVGLLKKPLGAPRKRTSRTAEAGWYVIKYTPLSTSILGGPFSDHKKAVSAAGIE